MGRSVKYNSNGEIVKSPIRVFDYKKFNEGTIHKTSNGDYYKIIEYNNAEDITIKFLDWYGYEKHHVYKNQIVRGWVWNPYRILYNGGYIGEGKFTSGYNKKIYECWDSMLTRAYSRLHKDSVHYKNSSVCEEWLCLQNFGEWYENYMNLLNPKYHSALQIDKDIKQWNQYYKIYSPQTCCLVPPEINILLNRLSMENKIYNLPIGVRQESANTYKATITIGERRKCEYKYGFKTPEEAFEWYKREKKKRISDMATFYYNEGAILQDVYELLLNIEILPYPVDPLLG